MAKYLLLSLNYGVIDERRFARVFGKDFQACFESELEFAQDSEWLVRDDGRWKVVHGRFSNLPEIRSLFYTDQALHWMQNQFASRRKVSFAN